MAGSLDEQLATCGKDIFMLQSDREAVDFWREETRAKIVMIYLQGCHFCHKFAPEFIKMAPTKANSDLLFGSASHSNVAKVVQFIPALRIDGFPTTILVDKNNEVKHVIPGYMPAQNVIDAIEAKLPELRGLPSLQYLQVIRREAGTVVSNRARLPSSTSTESKSAHDSKNVPPGVTAGSGVAGQDALPPHLRQPPTPTTAASVNPNSSMTAPCMPRVPALAAGAPRSSVVATLAGRKHKSAKHHHRSHSHPHHRHPHAPKVGGRAGATDANSNAEEQQPQKSWCTIL